ncbi:Hypothetical predicted protein, partial [Mytilus galloprovincialis]
MVDHMQVGFSPMDGGSHAGWIFDDGWWITCRLDFRRWMVDHMQVGFSTMDGGSHAGWIFDDGWWITCKLDFRRWMVDHMQNNMGDMSHSGSGDHNPVDHHDGTKVHLWGHKSPITADHTTYNFEQDPDLVVEIDIPINKRITSAGNKRVLSASAISGSGTDRSYRSNSGFGRPPVKSRSRPMKPHE